MDTAVQVLQKQRGLGVLWLARVVVDPGQTTAERAKQPIGLVVRPVRGSGGPGGSGGSGGFVSTSIPGRHVANGTAEKALVQRMTVPETAPRTRGVGVYVSEGAFCLCVNH